MILVRTCGSGTVYNDERLKLLKKNIEYFNEKLSNKIFKIQDHKGELNVYWFSTPSISEMKIIDKIWDSFNEYLSNHFVVSITQKKVQYER